MGGNDLVCILQFKSVKWLAMSDLCRILRVEIHD